MNAVFVFLATSIISFVGSVQLGPVNLSVIRHTLERDLRTGLRVASGGCVPEIIYSSLAIWGVEFIGRHESFFKIFELVVIPVFLGLGIYNYLKKEKSNGGEDNDNGTVLPSERSSFLKGFLLGMLNPQLFIFWFTSLVYINSFEFMKINDLPSKASFVAGTAAGAFILLFTIAAITHQKKAFITKSLSKYNINRIVGIIFMLLAVVQAYNFYAKNA